MPETTPTPRRYSFLGPAGTFTEAALRQVPEAQGQEWAPVANIGEALNENRSGFANEWFHDWADLNGNWERLVNADGLRWGL